MSLFDSHSARGANGEYVESTGFHLLELHLPSMGISWLFVGILFLVAGIVWLLSRRYCRPAPRPYVVPPVYSAIGPALQPPSPPRIELCPASAPAHASKKDVAPSISLQLEEH